MLMYVEIETTFCIIVRKCVAWTLGMSSMRSIHGWHACIFATKFVVYRDFSYVGIVDVAECV